MDGTTAQIAALTIAGNHYLAGGDIRSFWPDAAVFNFCKFVRFITLSGDDAKPDEHPYTDDPPSWFAKQKDEGVLGLRLIHMAVNKPIISDRMSAGFVGGGGRKLIEAVHAKTMDGWEAGWRAGERGPDKKIWQVNYARIGQGLPRRDIIPYNITGTTHALEKALAAIRGFAQSQDDQTRNFVPAFDEGLAALASKTPLATSFNFKGYEAMLPDVGAQRLISAADSAWVFGAMGSWNDMGFEGEAGKTYDTLSEQLFQLLIDSITTAVNTTFKAPG